MIDREFLFGSQPETPLESSSKLARGSGVSTTIEPPEPPGRGSVVIAERVQEDETPVGHAPELRDGALELLVIEVMRDRHAEDGVEGSVSERKQGRVRRHRTGVRTPPAQGDQRARIEIDENRIDPQAGRKPAVRASDVEDSRDRPDSGKGASETRGDLRLPGEILNRVVKKRAGD